MTDNFIKLAYQLGYARAIEKQAAPGILGRLFEAAIKKPSKRVIKAVFDPMLGLSDAGTNAEIRRRTGKWIRDEIRHLTIPAAKGKPAVTIDLSGREKIPLYHRPAAVLHHLLKSGPNADLHRATATGGVLGIGALLGLQKMNRKSKESQTHKGIKILR